MSTAAAAPHPDLSRLTLRYRLRVGVVGHRKLADPARVETAVRGLLDRIEQALTADKRIQLAWTVVSPLAKGADRIVARAVLDRAATGGVPELEVITPLPLDEYRRDFETPDDRDDFEQLLARRTSLTELATGVPDLRNHVVRDGCYLEGGMAVVRACEILIAVWDGAPAKGKGGTGQIVTEALERRRIVLWIPANTTPGDPKLLRRRCDWMPAWWKQGVRVAPLPVRAKGFSPGAHQLAAFLRDRVVSPAGLVDAYAGARADILEPAGKAHLCESVLAPVLGHVTPYYARADAMAAAYQARHTAAIRTALYLAALAVTSVAFQVVFAPEWHRLLWIEVASMLGVLTCLGVNRRQAWHEKWVHDRYVAEQLRTAGFALVLGEDASTPVMSAPKTLPFYVGPQAWLPAAIGSIVQPARGDPPDESLLDPARHFIAKGWLLDQSNWHKNNATKKHRLHRRRQYAVVFLFVATLGAAALHLMGGGQASHASAGHWYTFLAIALPAWATAIHAAGKQLEHERVSARSRQMAQILERLGLTAQQSRSMDELRTVVREAMMVVALENHEWSVLLSFARPELAV